MSSDVATTGNNLPANPADLLSGLKNMQAAANVDATRGKGQFMRFVKGAFFYGVDRVEVEEGSNWAINPASLVHGYQAWGDGVLLGEEVASMAETPIIRRDLEVHHYLHPDTKTEVVAEWKPFRGFQLVCVNGEDEGIQCFLSGTSIGLKNAVDGLVKAIVGHMEEDPSTPVAIVDLKADFYQHGKYGEIWFPVFEIIEWLDMEATVVPIPDEDEEEEGDAEGDAEAAAREGESAPTPESESRSAPKSKRTRGGKAPEKAAPTAQRRTRRRRGAAK